MKRIDNSRVVRAGRSAGARDCWKLIGSVVAAAVLLIGVLLPSAYGLLAGYQIQSLRQESAAAGRRAGVAGAAGSASCFRRRAWRNWRASSSSSIRRRRRWCIWTRKDGIAGDEHRSGRRDARRGSSCRKLNPPGGCSGCCGSCWCGSGVIFGRLVWLQVFQHDDLLRLAQAAAAEDGGDSRRCAAPILDRTGQPLAKSLPAESVCVNPQKIPDAGVAADLLSRILDLDRAKLFEQIADGQAARQRIPVGEAQS